MNVNRRDLVVGGAAVVAIGSGASAVARERISMHGLIGKMIAKPGQRDALAAVLLNGVAGMPGCLSYVVANDPTEHDVLWITEVWESREAHTASLALPSVRDAIAKGRPMIAGMTTVGETVPIGGHGLKAST